MLKVELIMRCERLLEFTFVYRTVKQLLVITNMFLLDKRTTQVYLSFIKSTPSC